MRTDVDLTALSAPQSSAQRGDPERSRHERQLAMQTWAPLALTGVLAALLGGWFLAPMLEPVTPVRAAPVVVQMTAESAAAPTTAVIASGWIEPDPYPTSVPPLVAGVIAELPVVEGTPLVKGKTVIARLDTTLIDADITRQTAMVKLAEADVQLAETLLANAEQVLAQNLEARLAWTREVHLMKDLTLKEALLNARVAALQSRVRQNGAARLAVTNLEASIADIDVDSAQLRGTVASTEAEMAFLEQNAAAFERMAQQDAAAKLDAVKSKAQLEMARQNLAAAKQRLSALAAQRNALQQSLAVARDVADEPTELLQSLAEAKAELSQQRALIESHMDHLAVAREGVDNPVALKTARNSAASALQLAQARLADARAELAVLEVKRREHVVVSPIDGEVMTVLAQPGMPVSPLMSPGEGEGGLQRAATALVLAYRPDELQARIDMPLGDVPAIGGGQKVEITCESAPGRTFEGTVLRLVRQADIARNTLQVKVRIHNPDPQMRPDMLVRARFLPPERPAPSPDSDEPQIERWFVPRNAVFDEPGGETVIMIYDPRGKYRGEGVAQRMVVERRGESELGVEVAAPGLSRTHRVILNPAVLHDGGRVQLTETTPQTGATP